MSEVKKQVKEEKSNNKVWIIVLAVLLLAINGIQGFFNFKQNNDIKAQSAIIVKKDAERDSLVLVLNSKIEELENARAEIQKLGGDITALNAQIEELDKLKETVKSLEKYKSMYFRVKSEVDNANRLAADSKKTADGLSTMLNQQDSMMQMQKQALALKDQNISTLEQERAELSQKVALASILKADNIKIIAVSAKGKEKEGDVHKAKSISKLKIAFTISENRVATKNTKDIYIRIVEPDGATISTSTETLSGEFSYNNKTLFYSMKTSILYNGYITPVTVTYTKEDEYKIGKHIVEVYCEGSLIGSGTFTVE